MATEKYDKKLAKLNLNISLRELSTQHAKGLNKLEEDLAARRMLNQGSGLRALQEFLEKKLKDHLDTRLNCITDSFYEDVAIDEATEKELKATFDRYLRNEENGLISLYSSRITRGGFAKPTKESAISGLKIAINKHRSDLFDKLKVAILKHNKSIKTQPKMSLARNDLYIAEERINELSKSQNSSFDFSKLIRFCEELNSAHIHENYLSIIMLVRSILNHVPPVFGESDFIHVASNYKFSISEDAKSFKKSMGNLATSSKDIADAHLHQRIKNKESLPTFQQVNFSADLDVLLAEIIRIS